MMCCTDKPVAPLAAGVFITFPDHTYRQLSISLASADASQETQPGKQTHWRFDARPLQHKGMQHSRKWNVRGVVVTAGRMTLLHMEMSCTVSTECIYICYMLPKSYCLSVIWSSLCPVNLLRISRVCCWSCWPGPESVLRMGSRWAKCRVIEGTVKNGAAVRGVMQVFALLVLGGFFLSFFPCFYYCVFLLFVWCCGRFFPFAMISFWEAMVID